MDNQKQGIKCKNLECNKIIIKTNINNGLSIAEEEVQIIRSSGKDYILCPHCEYKNYIIISGDRLRNIRIQYAEK